jgi:heme exporter protein B
MSGFVALLNKDLKLELRSGESTIALFGISLLVLIVLVFALERAGADRAETAAGALWVALIFSGLLGATRALQAEWGNGCMSALLLSPLDRGALYAAKLAASIGFMLVAEAAAVVLIVVFFNLEFASGVALTLGVLALGIIGFAAVATLLAAISAHTRASDLLLALLAIPLYVPALIAGVRASAAALSGAELAAMTDWLGVLVAFDVLFVTAGYLLFDHVVGED